jgi:hypothetical protein
MKYKVGDKVRVRSWKAMEREFGLDVYDNINCPFIAFNRKKELEVKKTGRVVTIESARPCSYLVEGIMLCEFTDEMLEGYAFEYGDEIEVSDDGKNWIKRIYLGYIDGDLFPVATTTLSDFPQQGGFFIIRNVFARPLTPKPSLIGKEVEVKVDGVTYTAKITGEK